MKSSICLASFLLLLFTRFGYAETQIGRLSPSVLNAAPSRYNDREVVVEGYVTIVPEAHNIYESKELAEEFKKRWRSDEKNFNPNSYERYCLTIGNPNFVNPRGKPLHEKMLLHGVFISNYLDGNRIDLGACPMPTAIIVDKFQQLN